MMMIFLTGGAYTHHACAPYMATPLHITRECRQQKNTKLPAIIHVGLCTNYMFTVFR